MEGSLLLECWFGYACEPACCECSNTLQMLDSSADEILEIPGDIVISLNIYPAGYLVLQLRTSTCHLAHRSGRRPIRSPFARSIPSVVICGSMPTMTTEKPTNPRWNLRPSVATHSNTCEVQCRSSQPINH